MKRLTIIITVILMALSPSIVLAGNIYWDAKATFHNDAYQVLPRARGTATVTYTGDGETHSWTVAINFTGLLADHDYVFSFGVLDQLQKHKDYDVVTDARGRLIKTFDIDDLFPYFDNTTQNLPAGANPFSEGYYGYTILRLLDMEGGEEWGSGGKLLTALTSIYDNEPDYPAGSPYEDEFSKATMVMRARQDGGYGRLTFTEPRVKKEK